MLYFNKRFRYLVLQTIFFISNNKTQNSKILIHIKNPGYP